MAVHISHGSMSRVCWPHVIVQLPSKDVQFPHNKLSPHQYLNRISPTNIFCKRAGKCGNDVTENI